MARMFETREITKLLDVLIGQTEAVGETNEDNRRLDNLKTLIDVTNWCLDGLEFAMASGRGRPEYSMAKIRHTAQCALDEYGRWIADILDEQMADRKTENSSEKPNNCEDEQTETQNSNKNSNVISVYDGVSEAVRCAMCNNPNKSDRGCDGACSYDEALYKKIIDAIHNCQYEPKDEPQTEIEWWDCIDHRDMEHHVYCTPKIDESRYEPQTETDKDLKEVRIAVARAKAFKTSDIDEPLTKCDLCKREGDDICLDCERKKQSGKE